MTFRCTVGYSVAIHLKGQGNGANFYRARVTPSASSRRRRADDTRLSGADQAARSSNYLARGQCTVLHGATPQCTAPCHLVATASVAFGPRCPQPLGAVLLRSRTCPCHRHRPLLVPGWGFGYRVRVRARVRASVRARVAAGTRARGRIGLRARRWSKG